MPCGALAGTSVRQGRTATPCCGHTQNGVHEIVTFPVQFGPTPIRNMTPLRLRAPPRHL